MSDISGSSISDANFRKSGFDSELEFWALKVFIFSIRIEIFASRSSFRIFPFFNNLYLNSMVVILTKNFVPKNHRNRGKCDDKSVKKVKTGNFVTNYNPKYANQSGIKDKSVTLASFFSNWLKFLDEPRQLLCY